jgi:hypothetical protein
MAAMQCEVPKNETSEAEFVAGVWLPICRQNEGRNLFKMGRLLPRFASRKRSQRRPFRGIICRVAKRT